VLVVGCGGLGGVIAAHLVEQSGASGADVVGLTTNETIAAAVRERGFVVRGEGVERAVRGAIVTDLGAGEAPFDWVILATQPPQVEEAARRVAAHLAPAGRIVCLQNGLCEDIVAGVVGADRVVGAVVAWGGAMPEPGLYDRTSAGGFTVGRMDGAPDDALLRLALLLEPVGPVITTSNLAGARWSKLAINCAISTLGTLGGTRLGSLMLSRLVRRLALEIMTEVVHVARAERVRLEKVSGTIDLEWIALTESERRAAGSPGLVAKHSMLLAVGARYRRMRSSMLSAIERGRQPAVDFLNGEIVRRGPPQGIATPFNRAACDLVHAVARRELAPGMQAIEELSRRAGVDEAAEPGSKG